MAAIEELKRKRKKRKKKRKKKPAQTQPPVTPTPPVPPTYRWIVGWDDSRGDGLVRAVDDGQDHSTPQDPATIPPRPLPAPQNPGAVPGPQPMGVYNGPFGRIQATRLLNRAGFGPRPGEAAQVGQMTMQQAVYSLTRPSGSPTLTGPAPTNGNAAIAPADFYGHDHLWWLDRMLRSDQQLVERMTLVFHDWFATSKAGVDKQQQMIDQNNIFRNNCFGSFLDMTYYVTEDPAMLQWLNGNENRRGSPNENYARELMELFTLGADRQPTPAYTEDDIREAAKGLTGWRNDWSETEGTHNFRFDPNRWQTGTKNVFTGAPWNMAPGVWYPRDICRLCVEHPLHASFFVEKLWSYFIPRPPSTDTRDALVSLYTSNNYAIRPVVEAILMHPDFYLGPPMVKPPVVFLASLLRAIGRYVDTEDWIWLCDMAGQLLMWPPNVSGWDDNRWLDTSRMRARWLLVTYALEDLYHDPWGDEGYDSTEAAGPALEKALGRWDYPPLRSEQQNELLRFSNDAWSGITAGWQQGPVRAMRENALQQLIAISPDLLLS